MKNITIILLSAFLALIQNTRGQGTAFTYQGLLKENGVAVNGTNDFQFTVYDTLSGNNAVSSVITADDVILSNGVFTVRLDFGGGVFNGNARWLEIGVRPGSSDGAYTGLSPRQAVTAAPYAVFAGGVDAANISGTITSNNLSASLGLWSKSGAQLYYNQGNVGVGTNNPSSPLEVNGLVTASRYSGATGTTAAVTYGFQGDPNTGLFSDVPNELALATQGSERLRVNSTGNVGIGTDMPGYRLMVANPNHQIAIADTDNANKTWTLTTIQGNNGFGIYEDGATARLVVEAGGKVTVDGGKAVVYNANSTEVMIHKVVGTITLNALGANSGVDGFLNWGNLGFTAPPAVFAGDFQPGPSGLQSFAQILVTPHSATTTGCSLRIFNAGSTSATLTAGKYNCLVIGNK